MIVTMSSDTPKRSGASFLDDLVRSSPLTAPLVLSVPAVPFFTDDPHKARESNPPMSSTFVEAAYDPARAPRDDTTAPVVPGLLPTSDPLPFRPASGPRGATFFELPLARFPLERCAEIAASIERRRTEARRILEENELAPDIWQALSVHWSDEIRRETVRGRSTKLRAYDMAYVARLEKERGVIRPEEYARILVGVERGNAEEALRALDLPDGALMRIERVWLRKLAKDVELAKSARRLLGELRDAE